MGLDCRGFKTLSLFTTYYSTRLRPLILAPRAENSLIHLPCELPLSPPTPEVCLACASCPCLPLSLLLLQRASSTQPLPIASRVGRPSSSAFPTPPPVSVSVTFIAIKTTVPAARRSVIYHDRSVATEWGHGLSPQTTTPLLLPHPIHPSPLLCISSEAFALHPDWG